MMRNRILAAIALLGALSLALYVSHALLSHSKTPAEAEGVVARQGKETHPLSLRDTQGENMARNESRSGGSRDELQKAIDDLDRTDISLEDLRSQLDAKGLGITSISRDADGNYIAEIQAPDSELTYENFQLEMTESDKEQMLRELNGGVLPKISPEEMEMIQRFEKDAR